mgnify:CR=1 FL=1
MHAEILHLVEKCRDDLDGARQCEHGVDVACCELVWFVQAEGLDGQLQGHLGIQIDRKVEALRIRKQNVEGEISVSSPLNTAL